MSIKNYYGLQACIQSDLYASEFLEGIQKSPYYVETKPPADHKNMTKKVMGNVLDNAVIYDAENVYEWNRVMRVSMDTLRGLPCFPPYPLMYLEFGEKDIFPTVALVMTTPRQAFSKAMKTAFGEILGGEGWLIYVDVFQGACPEIPHVMPMGKIGILLDKNGHIESALEEQYVPFNMSVIPSIEKQTTKEQREGILQTIAEAGFAVLLTFALSHMKNVVTKDNKETMSRQQRRYRERTGQPAVVYKTVEVVPFRNVSGNSEKGSKQNTKRAHLVAGHIARYGPEHGTGKLFGKYEGVYFIPPHIRGNPDVGLVEKDYRLADASKESPHV